MESCGGSQFAARLSWADALGALASAKAANAAAASDASKKRPISLPVTPFIETNLLQRVGPCQPPIARAVSREGATRVDRFGPYFAVPARAIQGPGGACQQPAEREKATSSWAFLSAPDRIRTCDLRFRRRARLSGGVRWSRRF